MSTKEKFDSRRVYFKHSDLEPGMIIGYKDEGEAPVPKSLMQDLTKEALSGKLKTPDYYHTWEFMERCIKYYEKEKQNGNS